jgi:hypothetical protein
VADTRHPALATFLVNYNLDSYELSTQNLLGKIASSQQVAAVAGVPG